MSAPVADYVVVGAGSAGCVVAEALSRDGRHSVIVIESGGSDKATAVRVPGAVIRALGDTRLDWAYRPEPDPTRQGRSEIWHRGRVLGGSGSINGCFFVRGRRDDFDHWAELGNAGWSFADVLPYFRELESFESGGDPEWRGRDGPFRVETLRAPHPLAQAFVAAAAEAGVPVAEDYNGANDSGAAIAQTSIRDGFRESAYRAFLKPALARKNLRLMTQCRAIRLVLADGVARGVACVMQSRSGSPLVRTEQIVRARREVILCAGAIGSPQLLLLSGIGPGEVLQNAGVPVRHDLAEVGSNLQEHVGVWIVAALKPGWRTLNMDYGWRGALRHGLRFLVYRDGPAASPTAHALAFAHSGEARGAPDLQIHFMPLGYSITPQGVEIPDRPMMMAVPNVNRPLSRGRVTLRSADWSASPVIEARLLDHPDDMRRLIGGCRLVRQIFAAPAFAAAFDVETLPGASIHSDAEWEGVIRASAGPVYHIAGTCRMGADSAAVVDPQLRVRHVGALRVIDSSIMPTITGGNTNATSMMIGARGAAFVLEGADRT